MKVTLNGKTQNITQRTLNQLFTSLYPDCDVAVIDGREARGHVVLKENMVIYVGRSPSGKGDLGEALTARNPAGTRDALKGATVGIAGAGGLGSNIAMMLARAGIGGITVADFDSIDLSNLNRQNFTVHDRGHLKVEALERHLLEVSPSIRVKTFPERLEPSSIPKVFSGCDVIVEAFDDAEAKAMILDTVADRMPDIPLVCGSGMAGMTDPSDMVTRRLSDRIYVCGDGRSTMDEGLLSTRVTICAGLMANKVLQLLTHSEQDV
ncbi:MAG: sulfur carrier protein ThiS adenylyltransferase ThiF [archaeon]|nr:sulfur carrier protein ThiS adenylyltransferase ThiF [archaeon]